MSERQVAPYGSWSSPISSELVAASGLGFSRFERPEPVEEGLYWVEARSDEGRSVLVFAPWGGDPVDVVPAPFNVRTSVHEYGGAAYFIHGSTVFFTDFDDQRLYRLDEIGGEPSPITPEPRSQKALRYADGVVTADGTTVICVRERHENSEVVNELVALPADGSAEPSVLAAGHDFYSFPCISPDGTRLAWTGWDAPQMPYSGTDLWVAELADGALGEPRHVAGGPDESIFQPQWNPDGVLHLVSDRSGWWNLYRERDGELEPLAPVEAELGWMQWIFGMSSYAFLPDGRIACILNRGETQPLTFLDPAARRYEDAQAPYNAVRSPALRAHGFRLVWIAAAATEPLSLVTLDAESGAFDVVAAGTTEKIDPTFVSAPEPIEFPTNEGGGAHAFFYPPANPNFEGPEGERPPLVVSVHGGPTSQVVGALEPAFQYLTSRGIAVVDVNYGGSTGYGREYLQRLEERWGPVDTADSIAAARYLANRGDVDPARVAITGGSAGGYTTLYALTFEDFFAAGASFFGVADLEAFRETTHKFEAHYDHWLLGPYPEAAERYRARSPAQHADGIRAPVLLLQGLEDKVVPPSQSEIMVEALRRNGVPFAYLAFEGEGHGFRRADTIRRAHEAVVFFFARVFGFELADPVEPVEIENL
jgi:dipeptidyl aminopeptidase/acylaminoacyl peptidase